jgi:vacuolar-type H+-ATPase subunit E/Vma4
MSIRGYFEAASAQKTKDGLKVRIRLMSAGQGSSGYYPEAMLQEVGTEVFPAGTKLFYNHPSKQERESHRDVRLIWGKTLTDAEYVEAEKALYAEAYVFEKDVEFISQIMGDVDLSIEAAGGLDDNGDVLLEYAPTNAVALVPVGGRDGKITELIEAHLNTHTQFTECGNIETDNSPSTKEIQSMTLEEVKALLKEAFSEFKTEILESLKPEDATEIKAVVKALAEADLPEAAVDAVIASTSPLETLETFKAVKAAVLESAKGEETVVVENSAPNVVVTESSKTQTAAPTVKAWN